MSSRSLLKFVHPVRLDHNAVREEYRRLHHIGEPGLTKEEKKLIKLVMDHNFSFSPYLSTLLFLGGCYFAYHRGRGELNFVFDVLTFLLAAGAMIVQGYYQRRRCVREIERILKADNLPPI